MNRILRIGTGTIGSAACEITLNNILIKFNDPKITRKIMRTLMQHKEVLIKIEKIVAPVDKGLAHHLMILNLDHTKKVLDSFDIPDQIKNYAHNCAKKTYRCCLRSSGLDTNFRG
jgi:hypothetical protein